MCGIFAALGENLSMLSKESMEKIRLSFALGQRRGPEFSTLESVGQSTNNCLLGFHRLAINGLDEKSHQPLHKHGCQVICNGEIYNYAELNQDIGFKPDTRSDCEVLLDLYDRYGIEGMVNLIDGVFAFVLVDEAKGVAHVARDAFGVRPLFTKKSDNGGVFLASEMKQLIDLPGILHHTIAQFPPGTYSTFSLSTGDQLNQKRFAALPFMKRMEFPCPSEYLIYKYIGQIGARLKAAVAKRVTTTDRPIACLLSGGLDSSLVTALVAEHFKDKSKLETYSIGLEGSEDLKYAQMVADYLGTNHTSIVVSEADFLAAIPEVIYAIESYDTTTVRASVGNFLVAKYIKEHSEAKVIFNGDGSDEMSGGYLYFHEAPTPTDFDLECRRLLSNIHYFDVLRSDRCISYHGLEARTPFLDRSLVEHYMTLPLVMRDHKHCKTMEKYILRHAFSAPKLLPEEVLWRTKEAFSDGVSSKKASWFETIQANIPEYEECLPWDCLINPPKTEEQKYYRHLFEEKYPDRGDVIPHFWMPRFTDATDSSARTLKIYDSLVKK